MSTVSETYLMGIREGREFLKRYPDSDPQHEYEACRRTLREGFSGVMAEFMRGERDFWKNRIK
jgi:hypothetical protein